MLRVTKRTRLITVDGMVYYYFYMGLLVVALVLWAVIALRDDTDNGGPSDEG